MSDQSPTPIFDLGKTLAAAEGQKPIDDPTKDTNLRFTLDAAGAVKAFGFEIEHTHTGEKLTWSLAGWLKQTSEPGGRSAGVKGQIQVD